MVSSQNVLAAFAFGIFLGLNPFSQIDSEVIPLELPFQTEEEEKKTDPGQKQLQIQINPQIYRNKHRLRILIRFPLLGRS